MTTSTVSILELLIDFEPDIENMADVSRETHESKNKFIEIAAIQFLLEMLQPAASFRTISLHPASKRLTKPERVLRHLPCPRNAVAPWANSIEAMARRGGSTTAPGHARLPRSHTSARC